MALVETERLIVRPICEADAEGFASLENPAPLSVEAHREKIAEVEEAMRRQELAMIVVIRRSDGAVMGFVAVSRSMETNVGELHYSMGDRFRGLGYMREAAPAVIKVAEEVLGITAFEAFIQPTNVASIAVAKRMGLELAGEYRVPDVEGVQAPPALRYVRGMNS